MRKPILRFITLAVVLFSCNGTPDDQWKVGANDPVFLHRTIKQITDIIVHDIFSPPVASRIYAYTSIAAYEVAIQGNPKFVSLAGQVHGLETVPKPEEGQEYCFSLASVQAALTVGKALIFSEDKMDAFYAQLMEEYHNTGIPDDVFDRSVKYGNDVAAHIMAWSSKDNYKQTRSFPKYTIVDDPSTWKPTPPAYMDAVEPHWNKLRTFFIDSAAQFSPPPPLEFSKEKDTDFYREAIEVYETGKNLTEEQKQIARFWDCNPFMMNVKGHVMFATKKISPGGHWINITNQVCTQENKNLAECAEAYARVSIALIDGFISCWDEKYRSRLIRPETYINQYIDENWTPLLQTPPFPEYTSGHSVISSAAAVTLTGLFGESFAFTDSTELEFGLTARSFKSFLEASSEAAVSRLYGGIHYRRACDVGVEEGKALGKFVLENLKTRNDAVAEAK
jgi:hypothetical protein